RSFTPGRRSGGRVGGGCWRGGSSASSALVASATRATARSNGSWVRLVADCTPLTLRTYWRAAASISSLVAAGSRPRSVVMFRHMPSTLPFGRDTRVARRDNRVLRRNALAWRDVLARRTLSWVGVTHSRVRPHVPLAPAALPRTRCSGYQQATSGYQADGQVDRRLLRDSTGNRPPAGESRMRPVGPSPHARRGAPALM